MSSDRAHTPHTAHTAHTDSPSVGSVERLAVIVRTPTGLAVLPVDDARQGAALVLAIARHWPALPTPVLRGVSVDREPIESDREHLREHRDTDREHPVATPGAALDSRRTTRTPAA